MDSGGRLADRYGVPSPGRRRALIGAVVALALLSGGWLAWAAWDASTPEVTSELVGYTIDDQHQTTARIHLAYRDADVTGRCVIKALAADHSTVGERTFAVPIDGSATDGTVEVVIRTERRATGVDLVGCTTESQTRPR